LIISFSFMWIIWCWLTLSINCNCWVIFQKSTNLKQHT
jgi:hypothetical protein